MAEFNLMSIVLSLYPGQFSDAKFSNIWTRNKLEIAKFHFYTYKLFYLLHIPVLFTWFAIELKCLIFALKGFFEMVFLVQVYLTVKCCW